MILSIDTSLADTMTIQLDDGLKQYNKKIKAARSQSEKLLSAIDDLLIKNNYKFKDIKKIKVQSEGGSFTSLRIGVLTANALAYALKIPVEAMNGDAPFKFLGGTAVSPKYESEPNIGKPRSPAC